MLISCYAIEFKNCLRALPNFLFTLLLQQPFHCEIEHKIGLTCYTSGAVTCRVRLDRGGYVPGEAISIWATITNNSRVTIKHTRASLTEVIYLVRLEITPPPL